MKCNIEFELDERVLVDNSASILEAAVKELTNAFYAWRQVMMQDKEAPNK